MYIYVYIHMYYDMKTMLILRAISCLPATDLNLQKLHDYLIT